MSKQILWRNQKLMVWEKVLWTILAGMVIAGILKGVYDL